jgi:polyhydroxyalkanoate synthesis regulator phasin
LPLVLGEERKDDTEYLDTCRIKRNTAEYNMAGVATKQDASELADFVKELREQVLDWLKKQRPELIP